MMKVNILVDQAMDDHKSVLSAKPICTSTYWTYSSGNDETLDKMEDVLYPSLFSVGNPI